MKPRPKRVAPGWDALYVADSRGARPGRKTILARISLRQTDKLSYAIGGSRNLESRDFGWSASVEYKVTDSLKLRSDLRLFSGNENTEYGRWARNDHVEFGVIYKQGRTGQERGQAQGSEAAGEGRAAGKPARGEDQSGQ